MVFHETQSDSKSPQISRRLLSILAELNNAALLMISTRPLIFKSSSCFINPLVTVPSATITFGITVIFSLLQKGLRAYLFIHFPSVLPCRQAELLDKFFFLFTMTRSDRLADNRWSVFISKSQRIFCVSFCCADSDVKVHHLFTRSNLKFMHNSKWITCSTQSCQFFYQFCANLLLSLYYYNITHSRVFHTSISRLFTIGVWVIASRLKYPGVFLIF